MQIREQPDPHPARAKFRWHGSLPSLGRSSLGATVPRGEKEKFGASGRSGQQTGASGCSLAVGRAAKPGNRAPRAPPRDALPGPRPAHPTPFPGRARSQRPLSETARAASVKKAGRTLHPGPWASGSPADLGAAAWLLLLGCRAARVGGTSRGGSAACGHGPARFRRAEERNQGDGVPSCSLSRARRSPGDCSGCSLEDADSLRRSCPSPPGHFGRLWTLGASSPIR